VKWRNDEMANVQIDTRSNLKFKKKGKRKQKNKGKKEEKRKDNFFSNLEAPSHQSLVK